MSTPMRHGPSQQGRTPSQHPAAAPTPQASTPFSTSQAAAAALSPHGPRSSPQQLKKSPAAATLPSGAMSSQSGNPPLNFDSPSAAAALGGLGLDINLDSLGVGGLVGGGNRSDEDDRKKRMDAVITALWNFDTARVSNDGLERLAVYLGLECLWETAGTGSENDKVLIIAGRTMGIEVHIKNHVVYHASLTFNEPSPMLDKHVEKASAILFKDLALGPGESQLTKKLSKFRINLERLATLDRLSIIPGLNCHEAVAGMWESLEKLHRWDVERLREDPGLSDKSEDNLRVWALCSRHGCPLVHTKGQVGLTFAYWKQYRQFPWNTVEHETGKTWGILIDCAPANSMVYTPVRVSDKWIGPNIVKANPTDDEVMSTPGPILDWLEPPNTLLPNTEENKPEGELDAAALSIPKPVEITFMATFDPPVVVTHGVAMEIYKISAFNAPLSGSTFDNLLFPVKEGANYDPSEPRIMTVTQTVPVWTDRSKLRSEPPILKAHRNTLVVDKPVYGQVLTHVPISHPKELVAMLPLLRQYAFLSLLLSNCFKPRDDLPSFPEPNTSATYSKTSSSIRTTNRDLGDLMSRTKDDNSPQSLKIDVVLSAHPIPRLQVVFPFRDATAMINVEIQLNGKIHIVSDNIFSEIESEVPQAKGKHVPLDRKILAEKLEVCEDIDKWVEFIKLRLE
ncbi:mediator of RNA polymerase II transcription subunit 1-domain-containing protein [Xylaria bambusicola]|uniref:mediator of RNA polymerase II transcription subunit 1-domain-containing protein n=1 Tax=Xylaria bambusicola TaxID=326684 RepID=UPI0020084480|nr:mediator of RNA polymerase II transcription subunit 1-domain-containing protein [Xylaria bambusicola]KAI0521899.1 mediator of RNA polymerase II transcription subunit 1-domain-containing protein [Xylaria bambusicola]